MNVDTTGCCTEMVPKDDTNTPKHSSYGVARALHALHQKKPQAPEPVPAPKIQDIQRMLEMPCGDGCSAHCSPACSTGKESVIFFRGVNHSLGISGNPYKNMKSRTQKPEISLEN